MNIQPAKGRILVRPVNPSSTGPARIGSMMNSMGGMGPSTANPISVNEPVDDAVHSGEVVAAGEPGEDYQGKPHPAVASGDTVFYPRHAGSTVHIGGKKHHFISHSDILATKPKKGRK